MTTQQASNSMLGATDATATATLLSASAVRQMQQDLRDAERKKVMAKVREELALPLLLRLHAAAEKDHTLRHFVVKFADEGALSATFVTHVDDLIDLLKTECSYDAHRNVYECTCNPVPCECGRGMDAWERISLAITDLFMPNRAFVPNSVASLYLGDTVTKKLIEKEFCRDANVREQKNNKNNNKKIFRPLL